MLRADAVNVFQKLVFEIDIWIPVQWKNSAFK